MPERQDCVVINGVVVTDEMVKAGRELADLLYDVILADEDLEQYPEQHRQLIVRYVAGDIDSITAIYMAMEFVRKKRPVAKVEPMEEI